MMAHDYNSNYLEDGGQEDQGLSQTGAKSETSILTNKSGIVVCACDPRYMGDSKKEKCGLRLALGQSKIPPPKN
jgi:hypothetical protein